MQITTLIELLMRHAVKLESIPAAAGDSSSQKNIQVCTHLLATEWHHSMGIIQATVSDSQGHDINRKYLACEWPSSAMTSSACKRS